jgi:hypothetical protein
MDERRKRFTERVTKLPEKKKEITAGAILAELKPELATVTDGNL